MSAVLALALAITAAGPAADSRSVSEYCQQVHGRYAIYANRDALWVVGSKHMLEVVIDALDKELQSRGWETTVAYGDFTICSERHVEAHALTIQDGVRVARYGNVRYARR